MIVRATAKTQALVGRPEAIDLTASGGNWYANVIRIEGRKCLLVTHADTLFSVFVPDVRASQLRPLGPFLVPLIVGQLTVEGLPADALGVLDPSRMIIAKTADRKVLGCMNDLTFACGRAAADRGGLAHLELDRLHHHLHRNLNSTRGYVPAIDLAHDRARRASHP